MKRSILLCVGLFWSLSVSFGQSLDLGFGVGTSIYWGDLNTPSFGTNVGNGKLAVQASANYTMTDYISIRANMLYGTLSGDDSKSTLAWQQTRNLDFSSPLIQLSVLGEFHVFGYNMLDEESPFSPFLAAGVSGFYFNPSTLLDGQRYDLQPLGTEGQGIPGFGDKYSKFSGALVFGGGLKVRLGSGITMVVDGLAHRTFTDYIDDISGDYVTYQTLAENNGIIAARLGNRMGEALGQDEPVIVETGTQRGGQFVTDYFMTGMVTFYLNLSSGGFGTRRGVDTSKCPKF